MRLIHYSSEPLGKLLHRTQSSIEMYDKKPRGLWLSVEGPHGWWERHQAGDLMARTSEEFAFAYEVKLKPDANILWIGSGAELIAFCKKYANPRISEFIDWRRVAHDYQGIMIPKYLHGVRRHFMWYYVWDCASGCIWDPAAIESTRLLTDWHYEKFDWELRRDHDLMELSA